MGEKKIHFMGFLTNTDASILQLNLKYGFEIRSLPEKEALDFIMDVNRVPQMEAGRTLFMQYRCLNSQEKQVYVIDKSIEVDVNPGETEFFNIMARFDNKFVHGYLDPTFRLMRLFKEGDLRIPLTYQYIIKNGKPSSFMSSSSGKSVSRELFHLESSELRNLYNFLEDTTLPFNRDFLQLAFENFERSYEISNIGLAFLTLMISLETLLNPGKSELRYRISRNAAVLLGTNKDESKKIFSEIKKLYVKRSKVVHTGKTNIIKRDDLLRLCHYVRESIKKMYVLKRGKDKILDLLNSCGFGEVTT